MAGGEQWRARWALTNLRAQAAQSGALGQTRHFDALDVEARVRALELFDLLDRNADEPELAEASSAGWQALVDAEPPAEVERWYRWREDMAPWL